MSPHLHPVRRTAASLLVVLLVSACGPSFDRDQVLRDAGAAPEQTAEERDDGAVAAPDRTSTDGGSRDDTGATPTNTLSPSDDETAGSDGLPDGSPGGSRQDPAPVPTGAGESQPPSDDPPATDPGPSPGVADDTIRIGYLVPLTGAAPIPTSWDEGARLYWDHHQVQDRDVELIIYDTESSTTTAVQQARRLVTQDQVFTILTLDRLEVQEAVARELEARNFPHLMIQSPTPPPTDWDSTFTISIDHTVQGRGIAQFMADELSDVGRKVAFAREQTNALRPGADAFVAEAEARGLDVVATESINPNSADYSGTILRLQSSGADIVWLYMAPTPAARIISQAGATGYRPTWFANSISWGFELMHSVTAGHMEGAYAFSPWVPLSNPRTATYKQAWNDCGSCDGAADDIGLVGWAAGEVLDAALEATPALGHDAFRRSMSGFRVSTGLWAPIDFTRGGSIGSTQVAVYRAQGGKWTTFGDFRGY